MIKWHKYVPFFMQHPKRKGIERKIAYRSIEMACEKGNYHTNICSWAYVATLYISHGGNPRAMIKIIPKMLKENDRNPMNYERNISKEDRRSLTERNIDEILAAV